LKKKLYNIKEMRKAGKLASQALNHVSKHVKVKFIFRQYLKKKIHIYFFLEKYKQISRKFKIFILFLKVYKNNQSYI
jgi:hypothetical protein